MRFPGTLMVVAAGLLFSSLAAARSFQDPLDTPSMPTRLAASVPMTGIAAAGHEVVAVGRRGVIVYGNGRNDTWAQAQVPVSSDLLAVSFPTPVQGWAVGHDGVILHTGDGGKTWIKQTDGQRLAAAALEYYQGEVGKGEEGMQTWVEQATQLQAEGADKPLLAVWFRDEQEGFVVGAFGLLFHTADGGDTWEPWMHRIDNPQGLHLYAIAGNKQHVFIVGEQGLVAQLDPSMPAFQPVITPYEGSYFGVTVSDSKAIVFGMRGHAFSSGDGGAHWRKLNIPSHAGITSMVQRGASELLAVTQSGEFFISQDGGESFSKGKLSRPMAYFGMVALDQKQTALAGLGGVRVEAEK